MHVAIVSDIHGNRHAFEAVLADARSADVAEIWCLGDLVGYGADPDACVALAREHVAICLAGNHDRAVTGQLPLHEFSHGAAVAARWTQQAISAESVAFLQALEPAGEEAGIGLYHASPRDPIWEYVLSELLAADCLDAAHRRISLIGHSHVALSFRRDDGDADVAGEVRRPGDEADLATGAWLLNPGSVGQPRDGDPRAAWLLLDTDRPSAGWRRVDYDIAAAQAAIRDAGLPAALADRLGYGQ